MNARMLTIFPNPSKTDRSPVWVDLLNGDQGEIAEAEKLTGFRAPARDALSEIESSSRAFFEKDAIYFSLPLITPVDDVMTTLMPVGFVISRNALLTVRFARSAAFDTVAKALGDTTETTPGDVFAQIFEAMVDRAADRLENAGSQLNAISRDAFHTDRLQKRSPAKTGNALRDVLKRIGQIGDRLSQTRDTLLGLDRISAFVIETPRCDFSESIIQRLKAVHADVASLNSYEEHLSSKAQFLLDATLGFISIEQNDIVKVLTVVSVVGVPPVLVAGIYGMNFKNMPEYDWALGYPYSLVLMLVTALVPWVWFKWRRWI